MSAEEKQLLGLGMPSEYRCLSLVSPGPTPKQLPPEAAEAGTEASPALLCPRRCCTHPMALRDLPLSPASFLLAEPVGLPTSIAFLWSHRMKGSRPPSRCWGGVATLLPQFHAICAFL